MKELFRQLKGLLRFAIFVVVLILICLGFFHLKNGILNLYGFYCLCFLLGLDYVIASHWGLSVHGYTDKPQNRTIRQSYLLLGYGLVFGGSIGLIFLARSINSYMPVYFSLASLIPYAVMQLRGERDIKAAQNDKLNRVDS